MYESHFGFTTNPFLLTPDPAFLYPSRQHAMAETILEYGLESRASFCLLTGEIGSGKTLLVSRLLRKLEKSVVVGLISHTHSRFRSIYGWAASALNLKPRDDSDVAIHEALIEAFLREYAQGRRTLLIIDEAQNLSVELLEELRLLSNVNSEKDLLLQMMLVGQPELRRRLSRPELEQFAQRVSVHFHLTALESRETHAYIQHRLQTAGGDPALFLPDAIDLVHARTRGVPRLINQLCDFALTHAYAAGRTSIDRELIAETLRDARGGFALPAPSTLERVAPAPTPTSALVPAPPTPLAASAPPPPPPPPPAIPALPPVVAAPESVIAAPAPSSTDQVPASTATDSTFAWASIPAPEALELAEVDSYHREIYTAPLPRAQTDPSKLAVALPPSYAPARAHELGRERRHALTVALVLTLSIAGIAWWKMHASPRSKATTAATTVITKSETTAVVPPSVLEVAPAATPARIAVPAPPASTAPVRTVDAPARPPVDNQARQKRLASMASQIDAAIASGALLDPPTDNAAARLRDMSSMSSTDPLTLRERGAVQNALLSQARDATARHQFEAAQRFVTAAGSMGPSSEVTHTQAQLRSEVDRVVKQAAANLAPSEPAPPPPPPTLPLPLTAMTAPAASAPDSATPDNDARKYFAPRALSALDVRYPIDVASDTEGYVTLAFSIQPDGRASDVAVIDTQPKGVFDRAAIEAIQRGHFDASIQAAHPKERARLKLTFKLR